MLCAGRGSPASGQPWAPVPCRLLRGGSPSGLPVPPELVILLRQSVHMDVKGTLWLTLSLLCGPAGATGDPRAGMWAELTRPVRGLLTPRD